MDIFSTSHGEGGVSGIGALVKQYVWKEVHPKKVIVRKTTDFVKIVHDKIKVNTLTVPDEEIEKPPQTTRLITLRESTNSQGHSTNTFC